MAERPTPEYAPRERGDTVPMLRVSFAMEAGDQLHLGAETFTVGADVRVGDLLVRRPDGKVYPVR